MKRTSRYLYTALPPYRRDASLVAYHIENHGLELEHSSLSGRIDLCHVSPAQPALRSIHGRTRLQELWSSRDESSEGVHLRKLKSKVNATSRVQATVASVTANLVHLNCAHLRSPWSSFLRRRALRFATSCTTSRCIRWAITKGIQPHIHEMKEHRLFDVQLGRR